MHIIFYSVSTAMPFKHNCIMVNKSMDFTIYIYIFSPLQTFIFPYNHGKIGYNIRLCMYIDFYFHFYIICCCWVWEHIYYSRQTRLPDIYTISIIFNIYIYLPTYMQTQHNNGKILNNTHANDLLSINLVAFFLYVPRSNYIVGEFL